MDLELYIPKLKDLWFRKKCMSDAQTMNYNAGYDVSYFGYHYNTGCIDFPETQWEDWIKKLNATFFYAYILDKKQNEFVGYVNFKLNTETKKATMGIVIHHNYRGKGYMKPAMELLIKKAKEGGVKYLTDTAPENRNAALKVFYSLGFKVVGKTICQKFKQPEIVLKIEKEL